MAQDFEELASLAGDRSLIEAMSSASLDSEASFEDRCRKIGISDDLFKSLVSAGYNTFGKVSFAAASTPQNLTDAAVDDWLRSVVSPLPSAFQVACVRRLLYESQLMHVADLKSRVEGPSEDKVRKLPVAERNARIEEQHKTAHRFNPHPSNAAC